MCTAVEETILAVMNTTELVVEIRPVKSSQLARALHWYHRGRGFKSRVGLNFFQALFQLLVQ